MSTRHRLAALACALACTLHAAPALAQEPAGSGWTVRLDAREAVSLRGMPALADGGAAGTMMYPAPNVIGLVAGIVTHGVIAGSMRDSARSAAEKAADDTVEPLRAALAGFTQQDLVLAALAASRLTGAGVAARDGAAAGKAVDSAPVFFLTPDHDALVLDNSVVVQQGSGEAYRNTIRVISAPHAAADPDAGWRADGGALLRAESARLLALSLDIAVTQASVSAGGDAPYRTVRYVQGKKELFERAQLLGERCGRALIRNLRGGLMSVPLSRPAVPTQPDCGA